MNNAVRLGGAALVQFPSTGSNIIGGGDGSFASRLTAGAGAPAPSNVSGQQVLGAATGNQPTTLGSLASTAAGSDSDTLQVVDSCRQFAMTNAIFDAGNAPIVDLDNEE